jgi:hypothetical protein
VNLSGAVTLTRDSTITSNIGGAAGPINFTSAITGANKNLTLVSGSGGINLNQTVGGVGTLSLTTGGALTIGSGITVTAGTINIERSGGSVNLGGVTGDLNLSISKLNQFDADSFTVRGTSVTVDSELNYSSGSALQYINNLTLTG